MLAEIQTNETMGGIKRSGRTGHVPRHTLTGGCSVMAKQDTNRPPQPFAAPSLPVHSQPPKAKPRKAKVPTPNGKV